MTDIAHSKTKINLTTIAIHRFGCTEYAAYSPDLLALLKMPGWMVWTENNTVHLTANRRETARAA